MQCALDPIRAREILGEVDDITLARIIRLGATESDLFIALYAVDVDRSDADEIEAVGPSIHGVCELLRNLREEQLLRLYENGTD